MGDLIAINEASASGSLAVDAVLEEEERAVVVATTWAPRLMMTRFRPSRTSTVLRSLAVMSLTIWLRRCRSMGLDAWFSLALALAGASVLDLPFSFLLKA